MDRSSASARGLPGGSRAARFLCSTGVLLLTAALSDCAAKEPQAFAGAGGITATEARAAGNPAAVGGAPGTAASVAGEVAHPAPHAAGASGGAAGHDSSSRTPAGGQTGGASGAGIAGGAGGAGTAGTAGASGTREASLYIGADITWVQADEARGATYSDGTRKDILQLLKDHGFNAIRLRTFVDPKAADGYDQTNGYGDLAHTILFGQRVKSAGMALLVDFHYSDNWADPGKQCVPLAWQKLGTVSELASAVHDYTKRAVGELVAGGARPDVVQIGNEITPGMLIHRCDSQGQPTGNNPVTGSLANWTNLGMLLKAASQAVKDVDPAIQVMLHIDRGNNFATSRDFIENAIRQGVVFEVFGESCYTAYQGSPSAWQSTFTQLAGLFPQLKFVIAEYGPEQRAANDVMFNLPKRQGLGTFNWEPTHNGAWNRDHALFSASGSAYTANADLALYDAMKAAYADRL